MKHILVTGATGFIASHLLPILHQQGWQITAAVRNQFLHPPAIPLKTVAVGDINRHTDWSKALEGIDTVIHLAARAHILQDDAANPEAEFLEVNTLGTTQLVKHAIKAGVQHFIFISSIGAMATLSDQILTENSPCQPDTPYGCSKLKAEQALIELASSSNKMTWTILRPTLVYGQGNPGNMERLIKLVQKKLPLPFGSLNNRRSLVFVGNLVDAIATIITHPQAKNQTFLISDGEDLSTTQLIRQIAQCLELPCHILPIPLSLLRLAGNLGDTIELITRRTFMLNSSTISRLDGSLWVDSSKLCQTLNWQPPYTLEQGLKETLQSYTMNFPSPPNR
ncbi:MAG: NAD-dependent epimerase/dehydratase family protein [Moorea sp. SIO2I5]|nr:NAD-dependent epimerase/dehydratase family protein [Moorena sp. SIO2I5]